MTDTKTVCESIDKLPPHVRQEALDYVEFLASKYQGSARPPATPEDNSLLGLFASEPGLISQMCESAMSAREQHPLRSP